MNGMRQGTLSILAVLVSVAIVFGSLMMSFVEGGSRLALPATDTRQPSTPLPPSSTPMPGTPTAIPLTDTPVPTETPTTTPTSKCPLPNGWTVIIIQPGDTLESLSEMYDISVKKLMAANCLLTADLIPGTEFYVPILPESTPTATVTPTVYSTVYYCGRPYGWVTYIVRTGDTLYKIATAFGTSVSALQQANCLGNSTAIYVGQQLYVPPTYPTSTPWISPTPMPTSIPTQAGTPEPPTPTPVPTPTSTYPETPTPGADTPTPVPTPTYTPPDTPTTGPESPTPQPSATTTLPPEQPTLTPFPTLPWTPMPTFDPNPTLIIPCMV